LRLAKRAVKRDSVIEGRLQVMCSWNLSALALDLVTEVRPLAAALRGFLADAAAEIAVALTEDPSEVVTESIKLPHGVTNAMAARRLGEMATIVDKAIGASSAQGARAELEALYGPEVDAIRSREREAATNAYRARDHAAVGTALGLGEKHKPSRSDGG
jgi:hypothetical protein